MYKPRKKTSYVLYVRHSLLHFHSLLVHWFNRLRSLSSNYVRGEAVALFAIFFFSFLIPGVGYIVFEIYFYPSIVVLTNVCPVFACFLL